MLAGLAAMIDPERGRRWREDRLRIDVDFGEVTWVLQREVGRGIPSWVAPGADAVALGSVPSGRDHVLALSICCEAMGDLGIDPRKGDVSWPRIREELPRYRDLSAKELYATIPNVLRESLRPGDTIIDHDPF